ncbi:MULTISPECIES: LysR family transcriptional regulator [unclassified Pseudomonas]|uniref:LysR family transcriptional regulator n=1 Tax=unclassified Pseudomonas TaxID=196821 RepID=UPI0004819459|nr:MULTISPECIES: LysR family transcriptional regulator [unclassified Pseudomonas]PXX64528.1 DNA-binding transcriptional LysR family regulator [Pseudomonas sp. LAIL14HWK12:I1]SMD12432.1 DNA-binding transcriptional regulator, LysR family [Pseudomonas sp. URIL14HWK12:I5]SOC98454.1 DNA-binding transcriptional regulator, LysR family [Pseudomonas sp. LAIL14HWK12:I3]
MELRHLKAFVVAAELQHFSRAAEQLGIAQPALSQLMRTLEAELGLALFRRESRGVVLTAAGEAFLPHARQSIESSELATSAARRARRGEVGEIAIGYHSALFEANLPQLLRHYFSTFPEVKVSLVDAGIRAQFDKLLEHKLDLAFARVFQDHLPDRLRTHPFSQSRLVLLIPDNHELAEGFTGELATLRHEKFVFLQDVAGIGLTSHTLQACRKNQLHPQNIMYVPSLMSIPGLVAAGIGLSIVPETITRLTMPGLRIVPLAQPEMVSELSLVSRIDERSRAVLHFIGEAHGWGTNLRSEANR